MKKVMEAQAVYDGNGVWHVKISYHSHAGAYVIIPAQDQDHAAEMVKAINRKEDYVSPIRLPWIKMRQRMELKRLGA